MRVSERHQRISIAKTELEIELHEYVAVKNIDLTEGLRLVSLEIRNILLDMPPKINRAETFSDLKDMIRAHQAHHEMTDIEVLQALYSWSEGQLNYMLRYERHGNYHTPAGLEK